jgi:hypothetical protein
VQSEKLGERNENKSGRKWAKSAEARAARATVAAAARSVQYPWYSARGIVVYIIQARYTHEVYTKHVP